MHLGSLDFGMPPALVAAIGNCLLLPVYLFVLTRLALLRERNALQFLASGAISGAMWIATLACVPAFRPSGGAEVAIGFMALAGGMIVFLEIWGLMSRGYTLGILLTLLESGKPLSDAGLMRAYRGGQGVEWIMQHRLGGLVAAGMISRQADRLVLTPAKGVLIARLYRLSIAFLGLRRTG